MTPLIDLISSTWASKRREFYISRRMHRHTEVWGNTTGSPVLFCGTDDECQAWIDRQCAEAVAGVIAKHPVAWRVMDHDHGWILRRTEAHALREAEILGGQVQPLFALETQA